MEDTETVDINNASKPHVLVVPYPGQGHINPMLQFSKRLASKELKVTLVTSIFIAKSMELGSSIGPVQLDVFSDGHDHGGFAQKVGPVDAFLARLKVASSKSLTELVARYQKNPNSSLDCIIYEPFMPWVLDVAKSFGLVAAAFFTQPCTVDYIYYNIHQNILSLPVTTTLLSIPGLPLLEPRDMPSFVGVPGSYTAYFGMLLNQFCNIDRADYVLINTFHELEPEVVDTMSKSCPILTIGPTIPSRYLDKPLSDDEDYGLDLCTVNESISTDWISTKPARSVIYVSFGSISGLSDKQMEELAWGLRRSNFHFLWVVRTSEQAKIPEKFVEDLGDKGLVVNWCPQVQILANEAVGCFFTHCGWNSTIEALSLGVPMVAMPLWTDQPTNAKLVEDVWKVGIRVKVDEKGIATREEIESCLREVMEGEKRKEIRSNAKKWKELAMAAVSKGGSSDKNISEFGTQLLVKYRN